jgi:ubiquitin-activating enzyme E1
MLSSKYKSLDETLYSRQLYVLGKDAMKSMSNSNILISGIGGLGLEIAKCIILGGVKSVTIHDTKKTELSDLSTQYYLSEKDIGKNRLVCIDKLKELNSYVNILSSTSNLEKLIIDNNYDVIILTEHNLNDQIKINNLCREKNIKFISCGTYGGFGNIFCDFGNNFKINDIDGEQAKSDIITEINYFNNNLVHINTAEPHNLSLNGIIKFNSIFHKTEYKIHKIINRTIFEIKHEHNKDNNSKELVSDLLFYEIKPNKILNFKSLEDSLKNPEFVYTDFSDFNKPNMLHSLFQAYNTVNDTKKINEIYDKTINFMDCYYNKNNDNIIKKLISILDGKLCPLDAIIGSIACQEIMKACSGKFHPINQWLYYDIISCLDKELIERKNIIKDRYYSQRLIFGNDFQNKLNDSKIFVVGTGAIGCEHLKNFSMIGIGNLITTDMDMIEKSNLNRQFLFRDYDIKKSKSLVACREIKKINPNINVIDQQNRVGNETLNIYNEDFFNSLTCVTNALDNVEARLFMDNLCIDNQKPLLESGTLGTKGNVQVIIPHLTESYGSSQDPPEKNIPICTLKNFPYLIDHTIQYARDLFEGYFNKAPLDFKKYYNNLDKLKDMTPTESISIINNIKKIVENIPKTYDDCINYAYKEWYILFRDHIQQLRDKFPEDALTKDNTKFWSGTKKRPIIYDFDVNNELHINFIESFSNLWASIFDITFENKDYIIKILNKLEIPVYDVKKYENKHISISEKEEENQENNHFNVKKEITKLQYNLDININIIEFEKDDDTNYHIDFIDSVSNLRALNYKIKPVDRCETKRIAGRIIPAIATTTSLVSGLVTIELYKLIKGINNIEKYNNTFINLALPFFGTSDPIQVKKNKINNYNFSFWDSIKYKDMKVEDLINIINKKYDVEISTITNGSAIIYSDILLSQKNQNKRLQMKIQDIYKEINNINKIQYPIILSMITDDDEELPVCKIYS